MTNKDFAKAICRHKGKVSAPTDINGADCYVFVQKNGLAKFFDLLGDTPCHYALEPDGIACSYLTRID